MTTQVISLPCPTCKKNVQMNDKFPHRPFCSKRCQLIDLGEWASESNRIPISHNDETDIWSDDQER